MLVSANPLRLKIDANFFLGLGQIRLQLPQTGTRAPSDCHAGSSMVPRHGCSPVRRVASAPGLGVVKKRARVLQWA